MNDNNNSERIIMPEDESNDNVVHPEDNTNDEVVKEPKIEWITNMENAKKTSDLILQNLSFFIPYYDDLSKRMSIAMSNYFKLQSCFSSLKINKNFSSQVLSSYYDSITKALNSINFVSYQKIVETFTPLTTWLSSFDTSLINIFDSIDIDKDIIRKYKYYYLQIMYETKWFPYAVFDSDIDLLNEINAIITTSKGASKNREKRIDKLIVSYYSKDKILSIKKRWWKSDLDYCMRRMLSHAINAYFRGEYILTISCLSTMWEGLIYIKANNASPSSRKHRIMKETKKDLIKLVDKNDYEMIFSDFFNNFIVSACNEVNDVIDGIPNRHGVAHSWYKKYPNKKSALNAILLTDFIISLEPIENEEATQNEQT